MRFWIPVLATLIATGCFKLPTGGDAKERAAKSDTDGVDQGGKEQATGVTVTVQVESAGGFSLAGVSAQVLGELTEQGLKGKAGEPVAVDESGRAALEIPVDAVVVIKAGDREAVIPPVAAGEGSGKAIAVSAASTVAAAMARHAAQHAAAAGLFDADGKPRFLDLTGLYEAARLLAEDALASGAAVDRDALEKLAQGFVVANLAALDELRDKGLGEDKLRDVFERAAGRLLAGVAGALAAGKKADLLDDALDDAEDTKAKDFAAAGLAKDKGDFLARALAEADDAALQKLLGVVVKKAVRDARREAKAAGKELSPEEAAKLSGLLAGAAEGGDAAAVKKIATGQDAALAALLGALKGGAKTPAEVLADLIGALSPELAAKVGGKIAESQAVDEAAKAGADAAGLEALKQAKCEAMGGTWKPSALVKCALDGPHLFGLFFARADGSCPVGFVKATFAGAVPKALEGRHPCVTQKLKAQCAAQSLDAVVEIGVGPQCKAAAAGAAAEGEESGMELTRGAEAGACDEGDVPAGLRPETGEGGVCVPKHKADECTGDGNTGRVLVTNMGYDCEPKATGSRCDDPSYVPAGVRPDTGKDDVCVPKDVVLHCQDMGLLPVVVTESSFECSLGGVDGDGYEDDI